MLYLYNFKKILDLGKYSLSNNADFKYILLKKQEIYAINDIIKYAHHKPGGENHIEFLQEYKSLVEEHLSIIINKIKGESDTLSNELTKFLNKNKEKYIKNDIVIINNHSFYINYFKGKFTFFTFVKYDTLLKMDMYLLCTYLYNEQKLKLDNNYIGYTNKTSNELRYYPSFLVQEIEKMDTLTTVEDVKNKYSKCEKISLNLFNLSKPHEIMSFNDPIYSELFGKPEELFFLMTTKREDNIIKLQLKQNHVENITSDLITLFKTERSYRNNVFYEEYETKEEFENRIKELLDKKNALLKKLNIDQDSLDKYISFINLQK